MSRQALIEQLTQAVYADYSRPFPLMWDKEPDSIHRQMQRTAEACLPVIVEFVADWISRADPTMDEDWMSAVWREEMQP